jgi:hypothetical protein
MVVSTYFEFSTVTPQLTFYALKTALPPNQKATLRVPGFNPCE